jgi:hypothetical protein
MTKLYANHAGWTDVEPHEVVEVRTPNKMMIRLMDAKLDPTWKRDFHPGGFFGHTANDRTQRWFITENPAYPVFAIRKHKNGKWFDKHGGRYNIADEPYKFHDHNF